MSMIRAPEFWRHNGLAARVLAPLGSLYHGAGLLRQKLTKPARLDRPVLCVGNLTSGGAGKTPVVLSLLDTLTGKGLAAHALTRGYGGRLSGPIQVDPDRHGAAEVGDEALLLAAKGPTWLARDRVAGARAAAAAGAEMIVMDDGFQNPHLAKDLSLVVVDGAVGLGNGRVLPAGPLRERPESGWKRADAVVIIGPDVTRLAATLPRDLPVLRARLVPEARDVERLRGRRVFAFAGIGRPEKFFESLRDLNLEVVETRAFADHHAFATEEIAALRARARRLDAHLVTTQKDWIRLSPDLAEGIEILSIAIGWEDPAALERVLEPLLRTAKP